MTLNQNRPQEKNINLNFCNQGLQTWMFENVAKTKKIDSVKVAYFKVRNRNSTSKEF